MTAWRDIAAEYRRIEQVFKDHNIHEVYLGLSISAVPAALEAAYQEGRDTEKARVDDILKFYLESHTDPEVDYSKHDLVSDLLLEMKE